MPFFFSLSFLFLFSLFLFFVQVQNNKETKKKNIWWEGKETETTESHLTVKYARRSFVQNAPTGWNLTLADALTRVRTHYSFLQRKRYLSLVLFFFFFFFYNFYYFDSLAFLLFYSTTLTIYFFFFLCFCVFVHK